MDNFILKHMPSKPMTQEEMEDQCAMVSKVAEFEITEGDELVMGKYWIDKEMEV